MENRILEIISQGFAKYKKRLLWPAWLCDVKVTVSNVLEIDPFSFFFSFYKEESGKNSAKYYARKISISDKMYDKIKEEVEADEKKCPKDDIDKIIFKYQKRLFLFFNRAKVNNSNDVIKIAESEPEHVIETKSPKDYEECKKYKGDMDTEFSCPSQINGKKYEKTMALVENYRPEKIFLSIPCNDKWEFPKEFSWFNSNYSNIKDEIGGSDGQKK